MCIYLCVVHDYTMILIHQPDPHKYLQMMGTEYWMILCNKSYKYLLYFFTPLFPFKIDTELNAGNPFNTIIKK